jgi:selenocysteine lyase/cysteine desulfurase
MTLDEVDRIGEVAIEQRARRIGGHVRETLSSLPGVQVMGSAAPDLTGPTSAFAFPGRDPLAIRKALWTRGKVATAASVVEGQGVIRFSPHVYNDEGDVAAVADILKSL